MWHMNDNWFPETHTRRFTLKQMRTIKALWFLMGAVSMYVGLSILGWYMGL